MFEDLTAKIVAFRDERDWRQFHSPRNLAASISIEAAELLEVFQWASDDELDNVVAERRDEIEAELADVLIYVALLAHDLEIELELAVTTKLATNAARYPIASAKGVSRKYNRPQPTE